MFFLNISYGWLDCGLVLIFFLHKWGSFSCSVLIKPTPVCVSPPNLIHAVQVSNVNIITDFQFIYLQFYSP